MGLFLEPFLDPFKNGSGYFGEIFGDPKWVPNEGVILRLCLMGHLGCANVFSDLKTASLVLQQ